MIQRIDWEHRGKTIEQLIDELKSFENQQLLVEISIDSGDTCKPISLVVKRGGKCLLMYIDPSRDDEDVQGNPEA